MKEQIRKKLGYTIPQAAEVAAVGESTLKAAIDRGDLPRRYPSTRPIILASDLEEWLESLPTDPPPPRPSPDISRSHRGNTAENVTLQQIEAHALSLGVSPETLLVRPPEGP